ncbi:MAG: flagellar type III secretion system pore protein FliP [Deltaproteobacteria bacterium]|nr:flagellar type III secretion system pore protein FliP [Deltaproteobacteria bacterium]
MSTKRFILLIAIIMMLLPAVCAWAEPLPLPNVSLNIGGNADQSKASTVVQLLLIITVLSLAPAILMMLTSFTRIVVVLSLIRHALGTQQMPPNQIIIGLALFLSFFIMTPVWMQVNNNALKPYYEDRITGEEALAFASEPIKSFMLKQTREKDLALFVKISKEKRPENPDDISLTVLIPAFVISELKTAFQIGFLIYLPFFIIDIVIASILLSMGMMMLPPIMISLPFKLLLFVLVDGWYLIVGSLVQSFG